MAKVRRTRPRGRFRVGGVTTPIRVFPYRVFGADKIRPRAHFTLNLIALIELH